MPDCVLLSGVTFRFPSCAQAALEEAGACAASALLVCIMIVQASCKQASARCWLNAFVELGLTQCGHGTGSCKNIAASAGRPASKGTRH